MKTKRFNKKLDLNKKTIVNLDYNEMAIANGGGENPFTNHTCRTNDPLCTDIPYCELIETDLCFEF